MSTRFDIACNSKGRHVDHLGGQLVSQRFLSSDHGSRGQYGPQSFDLVNHPEVSVQTTELLASHLASRGEYLHHRFGPASYPIYSYTVRAQITSSTQSSVDVVSWYDKKPDRLKI